jgi:hypothetical protein
MLLTLIEISLIYPTDFGVLTKLNCGVDTSEDMVDTIFVADIERQKADHGVVIE